MTGHGPLRRASASGPVVQLLGEPRVVRDGVEAPAPRGRKAWALLAYLARHPEGVGRSHLAGLLFEDAEDPLAALRWNLSEVRRSLGEVGLRGARIALSPDLAASIDVVIVAGGAWPDALAVPGLGLDLLAGMSFPNSPAFEVWLASERRRMTATAGTVLREAALANLGRGAAADAAHLASRLVVLDPLDENNQVLLVRCLAAAGDGVGAARQVAACTALLARELAARPSPALAAALDTATASPTARPTGGRAGVLAQLDAGEAAIGAGVLEAGLQCLRRAIVEADGAGDVALRVRARVALGGALVRAARGRDEEGVAALHEALEIGGVSSPSLAAAACRELGYVDFLRASYDRALAWLRRADALVGDDRAERARIATVHGSILSDTAHYAAAESVLGDAETLSTALKEDRQLAFILSMRGRVALLCGRLDAAVDALDRSLALARPGWTAFVPWPQSLRAEVDLRRGRVDAAADGFDRAFALGCQLGDPCWEGIAARGVGLVAHARGDTPRAVAALLDSIERCTRLPDGYVWGKAYALDALCTVAIERRLERAADWVAALHALADRSGMRELTVRAHRHRAALGHAGGAAAAAALAPRIDNPALTGG